MIDMNLVEQVRKTARGYSMSAVWQHLDLAMQRRGMDASLENRTETFFELLKILYDRGDFVFGANGKIIDKKFHEVIEDIKSNWPESPGEDNLDGSGFWFLIDCPCGLVWLVEGEEPVWT